MQGRDVERNEAMRDTIDMAREAGFAIDVSTDPNSPPSWWGAGHDDRFKAFEALVRADEREEFQRWFDAVTAQHKQEILAEREACAKLAQSTVCDTHIPTGVKIYGTAAAKAIRERGGSK